MDLRTPGTEKFHWVDGNLVEQDALRIAEKVKEFDPDLSVQYLEHAASIGDAPFRVVRKCEDGIERTILYAWTLDDNIIHRLYLADTRRHDILNRLDKENTKAKKNVEKKGREQFDEAKELTASIIKSPKDVYTYKDDKKGIIKFKSSRD